jgi:hypothetical protein
MRVTATAKDNYVTGTAQKLTAEYTIYAYKMSNVKVKTITRTYNGKEQMPDLVVTYGSGKSTKTLVEGTDYTVVFTKNQLAGTATAKLTGMGAYRGTKTITFKINKASASNALKVLQ